MEIVVKRTFPFFFVYRTRKNHQADALDFHFLARSAPSMGWKWICLLICASSYECFHTLITMIALKKRLRLGFNPLLVLMSENESFVFLPLLEKKLHKRREKADALILHHSQVWTTFRAAYKAGDNSWFESSLTKTKINKKTVAVHALLQLAYIVAYQNRCARTRRNFFLSSHRERFKSNYASRGSKCANKVNCSNYDRSFSEIFRQIQFQFQQVSVQGWYRDCKDARQCLHRKSVAVDMRFSFICIGAQIVSRCPMRE